MQWRGRGRPAAAAEAPVEAVAEGTPDGDTREDETQGRRLPRCRPAWPSGGGLCGFGDWFGGAFEGELDDHLGVLAFD